MTIEEIFKLERIDDQITELKKRPTDLPDALLIKGQWDPLQHDVMDTTLRPDKTIYQDDGVTVDRYEYVARIALAFQQLIVNRAAAFLFGNPAKLIDSAEGQIQNNIMDAIRKVLRFNRETSLNMDVGKNLMGGTEVAEYWYTTEQDAPMNIYGFESKYKLRHDVFSPLLGDDLYPLFDPYGDMIAFSREFILTIDQVEVTHFEIFTAKETILYKQGTQGWEEVSRKKNPIGKIPVIYATQTYTEWNNVQNLIDRLEKLASNFADTNDYHSSPTIIAEGQVRGFIRKGEQGKLLEVEPGAKVYYLSWDRAPEAVQAEKDALLEYIYTLTQTPNISFDNLKNLGAMSGVALKLMFMDAHLKAEDKKGIILEYLQRRINIIKSYLAVMNTKWGLEINKLEVTPDIDPYMILDDKANVELMLLANGNSPVVSQKTSVEKSGLVIDPEAEYEQIRAEAKENKTFDITEPTE